LGVEDAGGQAQQGMNVCLFEELASNGLPSPRLCEFVALNIECALAQAFTGAAFEKDNGDRGSGRHGREARRVSNWADANHYRAQRFQRGRAFSGS